MLRILNIHPPSKFRVFFHPGSSIRIPDPQHCTVGKQKYWGSVASSLDLAFLERTDQLRYLYSLRQRVLNDLQRTRLSRQGRSGGGTSLVLYESFSTLSFVVSKQIPLLYESFSTLWVKLFHNKYQYSMNHSVLSEFSCFTINTNTLCIIQYSLSLEVHNRYQENQLPSRGRLTGC